MPNVLLFGCDRELVTRLAADSRWNIAVGVHGEAVSPDIPDPRYWNLIVDDCEKQENVGLARDELPKVPRYSITSDYMREAERAHGIRLCGGTRHLQIYSAAPTGHKELEFNPSSDAAQHLIDFIDLFEDKFAHARLRDSVGGLACMDIFADAYDETLLEFHRVLELPFGFLCSIDMVDKAARIDALFYLCQVTVPRLWPDVYSDLYRPKRVVQLEQQRAQVIASRRQEVADIEQKIQDELQFFAPYANLGWLGGDELKEVVAHAFEKVFGFAVRDLDAEIEEGEPKTLDLLVQHGAWSAMMEVRSSTNRNARQDDLENVDENYDEAKKVYGETDSKLLVFNGMFGRDVEQRRRHPTFSKGVIQEARTRSISLVSSEQLLRAVDAHRNGEMAVEQFIEALREPGLFVPPWGD